MKRMTQKEWKENYCCPVCRGNNIDSGKILGPYEYERICEDCGTEFTEIMSLVGYKVTKKGTIKKGNNMKLTENEINLLKEIYTEPETIEGHCFTLDWEVNFGKGVLGSLNKKGLVESEERTSLGGWEFTGNTNGLKNKAGAETNIMIGLTPEGLDKVETLY